MIPTYYRKQRAKRKRNRLMMLSGLIIITGAIIALLNLPSQHQSITAQQTGVNAVTTLSAAESGLLPWHLQAPLSRMAVYPGADSNHLILAGGLTSGQQTVSQIYRLNVQSGSLTMLGSLPTAIHDAAYARSGNNLQLFGGGVSNSYNSAYSFGVNGTNITSSTLPQLRSDAVSTTVGNTTYIIGGYNGNSSDASILSTTDGRHFINFGSLPVPVRYAAVVSSGKIIYIFGGETINGGSPLSTVQEINTVSHQIKIANWKLPVPLSGAAAFNINGEIFLAGGISNQPENIIQGVGTTQVPGIAVNSSSLTQNTIWAVDTAKGLFLKAGVLQLPVANAGVSVIGSHAWIVGGEYNGSVVSSVQMVTPNPKFGIAGQPGAGSPYYGGNLLIADRGNNRLLVLNPSLGIKWQYPSASTSAATAKAFYFPDDAFFTQSGHAIISNQENNNTIIMLGYPSGKVLWTYGHPLQSSFQYGYLKAPDDAYLLKNNEVVVADDQNCRVLFISLKTKAVLSQIGTNGVCVHNPNVSLGYPNGDTPLYDGNVLISEIIGSWVSEYTPQGKMVWTTHLPISYPSDPQQLGASPGNNPNKYLIADYSNPGAILTFNRQGQVLSRYQPTSGPGRLNEPSLVELLPSGVYMANDDHRDRMVAIDPTTQALVWQYGTSDQPGTSVGMLHKPDGFDLLLNNNTTPTHGATQ